MCTFQYPTKTSPTVYDITLQASLNSRVAVIGPNGAGKSTLIKMFCGEVKPNIAGTVWRHQNMRIAFVHQHAFHHLDKHLDETPNEYIQWRYSSGEDRESVDAESKKLTQEEEDAMNKVQTIRNEDGTVEKKVLEALRSRRKTKRSYEYECKWLNKGEDHNTWLSREKLEEMGWAKMVQRLDQQEALRAGLAARPLTTKFVEKQLGDMGLEAEFATHSRIRGLSGGQKVKVVIAGCMWNNPHILVMDEPTNYLDRDSLGALPGACGTTLTSWLWTSPPTISTAIRLVRLRVLSASTVVAWCLSRTTASSPTTSAPSAGSSRMAASPVRARLRLMRKSTRMAARALTWSWTPLVTRSRSRRRRCLRRARRRSSRRRRPRAAPRASRRTHPRMTCRVEVSNLSKLVNFQ